MADKTKKPTWTAPAPLIIAILALVTTWCSLWQAEKFGRLDTQAWLTIVDPHFVIGPQHPQIEMTLINTGATPAHSFTFRIQAKFGNLKNSFGEVDTQTRGADLILGGGGSADIKVPMPKNPIPDDFRRLASDPSNKVQHSRTIRIRGEIEYETIFEEKCSFPFLLFAKIESESDLVDWAKNPLAYDSAIYAHELTIDATKPSTKVHTRCSK